MHISEPLVDLFKLPVVRNEIVDVHRSVQIICASHEIAGIIMSVSMCLQHLLERHEKEQGMERDR